MKKSNRSEEPVFERGQLWWTRNNLVVRILSIKKDPITDRNQIEGRFVRGRLASRISWRHDGRYFARGENDPWDLIKPLTSTEILKWILECDLEDKDVCEINN